MSDLAVLAQIAQEQQETSEIVNPDKGGISIFDLIDIEGTLKEDDYENILNICTYCGGSGRGVKGEIPCPECGREFKVNSLAVSDFPSYINVPERYRENEWKREKASNNPKLSRLPSDAQKMFNIWLSTMDSILNSVKENKIFRDSYLISAPEGFGKTIWTFTLIKYLYKNNIDVSNILFLNELDAYGEQIKKHQVLIIKVTKMNFTNHIDKLDYIIQKRKMRDLPTFVVTSIPYNFFVSPVDNQLLYFNNIITLI